MVAGVGIGLGVDRVPVGVAAVGDERLGAVDDVLVAPLDGARAHARHVGARVGLGQAERRQLRCLGQHPEVGLLDLLRAAEQHRRRRQPVARDRRADPRAAPAELFLDQHAVHRGSAGPSVLLRDVGVHQPHLPGLLNDRLRPSTLAVITPGNRADLSRRSRGKARAAPSAPRSMKSRSVSVTPFGRDAWTREGGPRGVEQRAQMADDRLHRAAGETMTWLWPLVGTLWWPRHRDESWRAGWLTPHSAASRSAQDIVRVA